MSDFLQNAYVFLWAILAIVIFAAALKSQKSTRAMAFVLSLFFVFMTIWYGLRSFGGYAMFEGTMGIIFKAVLGIFLAALVIIYLISKRKSRSDDKNDSL